jgi:hypothetical protein
MKIAAYGASGMITGRMAAEAVSRHAVSGVTGSGGELPPSVTAVRGSAGYGVLVVIERSELT